jgi:2'-5' RNA ligase
MNIVAQPKDKILLVDFDGTLSKFEGLPPNKPGAPLEGVLEFIPKLYQLGWKLHIFSRRVEYPGGLSQIEEWMKQYDLPYDAIIPGKPTYNVIVDDNAISPSEHSWKEIYNQIIHKDVGIQKQAFIPGTQDADFSCLLVALPDDLSKVVLDWINKNIQDNILFDKDNKGKETYPHITVKYGIHSEDPEQAVKLLENEKPINFSLGQISLFDTNEDFDVVKIEVKSKDLENLNKKVSENIEVTDTHPGYIPHVTLAFVQKGFGDNFKGMKDFDGMSGTINKIIFSSSKKEKGATDIPLKPQEIVTASESVPDAIFVGMMPPSEVSEMFPLFNITKPGHPSLDSTVTQETLQQLGLKVPEVPEYFLHLSPEELKKANQELRQQLLRQNKKSSFYPSLITPPHSHDEGNSEGDCITPFLPEWDGDEAGWHYPYNKRPINWQEIIPFLAGVDKKYIQKYISPEDKEEYTDKASGLQPNTTWDGNEPFEALPTQWRLNDNSDNYWQQYSRQYKGLRDNKYWDNLELIFKFLADESVGAKTKEDIKHPLLEVSEYGPDFILAKTSATYDDKEQDEISTKNREDSGDWFHDDEGGGNVPHDWNSNTTDFPKPKDIQWLTPLDQLVPIDRRFDRWITPPTAHPPDFLSEPMSNADEVTDYDYEDWQEAEANLISFRELKAAQETLYHILYAEDIPMDHHESDLYVLNSPEALNLIHFYEAQTGEKLHITPFTSQIDNKIWLDIPGHYMPFWDKSVPEPKKKVTHSPESDFGVSQMHMLPEMSTRERQVAIDKLLDQYSKETDPKTKEMLVNKIKELKSQLVKLLDKTADAKDDEPHEDLSNEVSAPTSGVDPIDFIKITMDPTDIGSGFDVNLGLQEIRGQAYLLDKIIPWSAKRESTASGVRLFKLDMSQIEEAINKANIIAQAKRNQIERVKKAIEYRLYHYELPSFSQQNIPSNSEIDAMFGSLPGIWWTKQEPHTLVMKKQTVKDLLLRNKFSSTYFDTFKRGSTEKYSWHTTNDSILVTEL